jgi:hypothetical protein
MQSDTSLVCGRKNSIWYQGTWYRHATCHMTPPRHLLMATYNSPPPAPPPLPKPDTKFAPGTQHHPKWIARQLVQLVFWDYWQTEEHKMLDDMHSSWICVGGGGSKPLLMQPFWIQFGLIFSNILDARMPIIVTTVQG